MMNLRFCQISIAIMHWYYSLQLYSCFLSLVMT